MEEKELFEKLLNKAYHLLYFRPRTEAEIRRRLGKITKEEALIDKAVAKLKDLNYLNEEEFVRRWQEDRQTFKPKGIKLIKLELQRLGVEKETIDKVLNDKNRISFSQVELATRALQKKILLYKNLPKREFKQKLSQFLARRGFDWETIETAVKETEDNQ